MKLEVLENITEKELKKIRNSNNKGGIFVFRHNCFGKFDVVSFKKIKLEKEFLKTEFISTLGKVFRDIDFNRSNLKANPSLSDETHGLNFVINLKLLETENLTKEDYILFADSINLKSDKFEVKDLTNSISR